MQVILLLHRLKTCLEIRKGIHILWGQYGHLKIFNGKPKNEIFWVFCLETGPVVCKMENTDQLIIYCLLKFCVRANVPHAKW